MRVFVLFILVLGVVGFNFGVIPLDALRSVANQTKARLVELSYEKKVIFTGLKVLDEVELQRSLPFEKSVFWWYVNGAHLEGTLLKHPLIGKSEIRSCTPFSWGCFSISVQEMEPKYAALVGSRVFVGGEKGKFEEVRSASGDLQSFFSGNLPIILSGIGDKSLSPDLLSAKLEYLKQAVSTISNNCNCDISRAKILENGELGIFVRNMGTEFRFDPPLEGGAETTMANISRKAIRMAQILKKLGPQDYALSQVDLAFDRVAVLKPAQTKSDSKLGSLSKPLR